MFQFHNDHNSKDIILDFRPLWMHYVKPGPWLLRCSVIGISFKLIGAGFAPMIMEYLSIIDNIFSNCYRIWYTGCPTKLFTLFISILLSSWCTEDFHPGHFPIALVIGCWKLTKILKIEQYLTKLWRKYLQRQKTKKHKFAKNLRIQEFFLNSNLPQFSSFSLHTR